MFHSFSFLNKRKTKQTYYSNKENFNNFKVCIFILCAIDKIDSQALHTVDAVDMFARQGVNEVDLIFKQIRFNIHFRQILGQFNGF